MHRADDALFRPVRTGNAFEETVERLLQTIKLGVISPGQRLPAERDLAARLHVSRVTLREAIGALRQAGYVESRRGRYGGTFVNHTLPRPTLSAAHKVAAQLGDNLDDAVALRQVLESGAAHRAATRDLSEVDRNYLRERLAGTVGSDLVSYRRMDSRLHLAIAEVAGSPSLTSAVADVRMRLNELLDAIPLIERNIAHSNAQHTTVVDAILSADPSRARHAMTEHLAGTELLLRGFLR